MRRMSVFAFAAAATLAACSQSPDSGQPVEQVAQESAAPADAADKSEAAPDKLKVALPQLAYAYALGYLLPADKIAAAQDAHRALCEGMGPARCQLLSLERGSGDDQAEASLKLRVASNEATSFQTALNGTVERAGGRAAETKVGTEDVSKQITDTQARIRQREMLVARLTEVLRTRKGSVGELVEAERSVAAAQEELDQARAWLTETRGRVAMSDFELRYTAIAPAATANSVGTQLGDAASASGANFLIGLRTLFTLAIYLAPWALLAFPVIVLLRRRRKPGAASPQA
jgi:hypothetical protein